MNNEKCTAKIRATIAHLEKTRDEFKALLDKWDRQDIKQSDSPFDCTLGEYIERKRSTHADKMRGIPLFTSFMKDEREISTEDSGYKSVKYFRDVPMEDFILIPKHRLLKYRLIGERSISVLKEMALKDGGLPHRSW